MKNNKLLPFERNRYYQGKLLTSVDFDTEQTYFNNKRRFLNQIMFGSGVVCGLSVYTLDDMSIMIESGVAFDDYGREIVVESSIVRKISAIDGFDNLKTGEAILCLNYNEKNVQPIYSVSAKDNNDSYEFNRIREKGNIKLIDSCDAISKDSKFIEFLNTSKLYSDSDYSVDISIPHSISKGHLVKLSVKVKKSSDEEKDFSLDCKLQMPSFKNENGENQLVIDIQNLLLKKGEEKIFEYWILAVDMAIADSTIIAKSSSTKIKIAEDNKSLESNFIIKVSLFDTNIESIIENQLGKINFENYDVLSKTENIYLAKIKLIRSQNTYFVDSIDEDIKSYIYTTSTKSLRNEMKSYFKHIYRETLTSINKPLNDSKFFNFKEGTSSGIEYASGVCEIPFKPNAKKGDIVYSSEIMHGLSSGNVFVEVGVEYLLDDVRVSKTVKNTIYGDSQIFSNDKLPVPYVETAVKVMNEKGSFVIGVKLLKDTDYVLLNLKWVAIKLPSTGDLSILQRMSEKSIEAVDSTILLLTRGSEFINIRFKNMEPCGLIYELTDKDAGEITEEGIYTAPAKEGVYEIKISCADMPLVSTYVYAIVKKKELDSQKR